ncbi:MAG TPA: 50S ribosomal protein L30 [Actinomycetota bacterium]|nr:50S ribosomal protein L30 [Actinomycetota bacterium]
MPRLKITQARSVLDRGAKQRGTIRALGLKRTGDVVIHEDTPVIRGMLRAVGHLLEVEETEDETARP